MGEKKFWPDEVREEMKKLDAVSLRKFEPIIEVDLGERVIGDMNEDEKRLFAIQTMHDLEIVKLANTMKRENAAESDPRWQTLYELVLKRGIIEGMLNLSLTERFSVGVEYELGVRRGWKAVKILTPVEPDPDEFIFLGNAPKKDM